MLKLIIDSITDKFRRHSVNEKPAAPAVRILLFQAELPLEFRR